MKSADYQGNREFKWAVILEGSYVVSYALTSEWIINHIIPYHIIMHFFQRHLFSKFYQSFMLIKFTKYMSLEYCCRQQMEFPNVLRHLEIQFASDCNIPKTSIQ